jgi:chemotaxis protein methyltransferase CheR
MIGPDFDHFCRLIHARSGLVLGPEKAYLVRGRLESIARSEGLADVESLLARIRLAAPEPLIRQCVDALATHESSFFRDGAPFETLKAQILPDLLLRRAATKTLRIWCAACSSGQEPYSLAIALQEIGVGMSGWRIDIMATDFSAPILAKGAAGVYSDFEVRRGLTPERLDRWFVKDGSNWRVNEKLRQMVTFRQHNLLQSPTALGTFDVILCRNVLIYFDQDRKRQVLDDLAGVLATDGALLLGSAETILGVSQAFEAAPGARGIYRKPMAAVAMTG